MFIGSADRECVYRAAAVHFAFIEWFPKQDGDNGCKKAMCNPGQKKGSETNVRCGNDAGNLRLNAEPVES